MTRILVAWFFLASLLWSAPARAALVTATYCVDWTVAFDDEDTGDFLTGTTTDAYGVVLRFTWTANGGGTSDVPLDWDGATPGCKTTLVQNSSAPFTVSVLRRAEINSNTIEVRNSSGALLSSSWLTGHTPSNGRTYNHTVGQSALQSENIMAAAGYALQRRNGGVTGETLTFIRDGYPERRALTGRTRSTSTTTTSTTSS